MSVAHGQDLTIRILRDGAVQATLRHPTDVEIDWDLTAEAVEYVGQDEDTIFGYSGNPRIRLTWEPTSSEAMQLAEAQDALNRGDAGASLRIDATVSIDHGDRGRRRYRANGCTYHSVSASVAGRNTRMRVTGELMCSRLRPIA